MEEGMELKKIYDLIDWSGVNSLPNREYGITDSAKERERISDFEYRWRCRLLQHALNGETEDEMRTARGMLSLAKVWDQVIVICAKNGLLIEENNSHNEVDAIETE